MRNYEKPNNNQPLTRLNFQIKTPMVRVVKDGVQLGVMQTDKARKIALEDELDLVEIAPNANPPVCHIMKYEKYKYEQKQKEKEQKRKQKDSSNELKEVRLSPGIQDHDINTKVATIKRFLSEGKKVLLNLQFKKRQIAHKEEGFRVVNKVIEGLLIEATVEREPRLQGSKISCVLEPKNVN